MLCISCHFIPLKPLTLQMDHAKLLDVLTSLPVSRAILPCVVCFALPRPANHAICSYIDSNASWPIRICLFIDHIILLYTTLANLSCFCCHLLAFKKIFFQEHYQSVKWFGSRSGPTFRTTKVTSIGQRVEKYFYFTVNNCYLQIE